MFVCQNHHQSAYATILVMYRDHTDLLQFVNHIPFQKYQKLVDQTEKPKKNKKIKGRKSKKTDASKWQFLYA